MNFCVQSHFRRSYPAIIKLLCLLLNVTHTINSSLVNPFQWIDGEAQLLQSLGKYMKIEDRRLDTLKTYEKGLIEHAKLYANEDELAWNPLAIYKAIKHLTVDLEEIKKNMIRNSHDDIITKEMTEKSLKLPDDHQFYDEIRNIARLRSFYGLPVSDVMKGHLAPTITVQSSLTTEDCFQIGKLSAEKQDHQTAVDWLESCEERFDDTTTRKVYEILIRSILFLGDLVNCKKTLRKYSARYGYRRILVDLGVTLSEKLGYWDSFYEYDHWESTKICAGDYDHIYPYRNVRCRYNHHNTPFLTIAPLKEEIVSQIPHITVFHEVLYDSEIEGLKTDAINKLIPGGVSTEKGHAVDTNVRQTHAIFLFNLESDYNALHHRFTDMTMLSIAPTEGIQMVFYVPGGFIRVHDDFLYSIYKDVDEWGQRILTSLPWFSDVILGGETAFTQLKLKVKPVKGSVLIWTNARIDGTVDPESNHAACPVIYGEKTVGVQWFRTKKQNLWITKPEDKLTLRKVVVNMNQGQNYEFEKPMGVQKK